MKVIRQSRALDRILAALRKKNKPVGFVPTMGSLHEGHLSLVRRAKKENGIVVVSIFVNPLQFGPNEDFKRYPRNAAKDYKLLEKTGADILFLPEVAEFYPKDFQTSVSVPRLGGLLCGASRPAHFAGVATVVLKLLNLIRPSVVYLGQKDYQQCRVIEQMLEDLSFPVVVCRMPIVREPDGLAMSSRNVFLSAKERRQAVFLHRSLEECRKDVRRGVRNASFLKKKIREMLKNVKNTRIDYVEIVDAQTLEPVIELKKRSLVLAALAVYFSNARLIDNVLIKV